MFNFIFGVLSVVTLILVGVLIVGIVKIFKLTSRVERTEQSFHREIDHIHRRIDEERRTIDNHFQTVANQVTETISYVDKRIDKSLNSLKEQNQ
jgi:uncharacterized membrane-anchored protein YhcB (DUF1043 family)